MKKLVVIILSLLFLSSVYVWIPPSVKASPAWLSGEWDKRVKITIDHNDVDTNLTDFPVLVYLSNSSGINDDDVSFVFDELQSDDNRKKIAITTSDEETECYVEIEKWDDANEQAWIWFKAPSISSSTDTDFYLYYDKDHANNTAKVGDPNSIPAENVWDSNFKLVSHMRDDPDTSHVRDSTDNDIDLTKKGAGEPAVSTSGVIDDCQNFDNLDDYVYHTTFLDAMLSALTLEAWVRSDETATLQTIMEKRNVENQDRFYLFLLQTTGIFEFHYEENNNGYSVLSSNVDVVDNTWHYCVVTWDTTNGLEIFVDGISKNTDVTETTLPSDGTFKDFILGSDGKTAQFFEDLMDEVRVSQVDRGGAWIKATYETGRDNLLDYGDEETPFEITFYFNIGGQFWVDATNTANGSNNFYAENTTVNLGALPKNASYYWLNFTSSLGSNSTENPYNYTVIGDSIIWCYFALVPEGNGVYIVSRFSWNISNPSANQTTLFDGTDSESSSTITNYNWTWGDSTPNGSGAKPTHSYSSNGTYSITLEITSADGTDAFTEEITIGGGGVTTEWFYGIFILGIAFALIFALALAKKS